MLVLICHVVRFNFGTPPAWITQLNLSLFVSFLRVFFRTMDANWLLERMSSCWAMVGQPQFIVTTSLPTFAPPTQFSPHSNWIWVVERAKRSFENGRLRRMGWKTRQSFIRRGQGLGSPWKSFLRWRIFSPHSRQRPNHTICQEQRRVARGWRCPVGKALISLEYDASLIMDLSEARNTHRLFEELFAKLILLNTLLRFLIVVVPRIRLVRRSTVVFYCSLWNI